MEKTFCRSLLRILTSVLVICSLLQPVSAFAQNDPSKKLILQLRWDHQFQFAGYYVAQWMGYYKDEGLTVDIHSAFKDGQILDATDEVDQGRADFGVGAANVLIAQDSGKKLNLVASIFQRSAVEYCALPKTSGNTIYDLSRLHIARRPNDLLDIELQALFLSEGIPPYANRFTDITRDFTIDDLTSGTFDVVPEYLGQISYMGQKKGIPLKVIRPAEYGIDFYGDTLFTSAQLAKQDPDLVERFRKASIRGWSYALEHPTEIADRIALMVYKQNPGKTSLEELKAFNRFQAGKVLELTHYPIVEIGNINPSRWGKMADTMKNLGIISQAPDLSTLIFDYNQVRMNRLQNTEHAIAIGLGTLIAGLTLFFLAYLKRRNTLLSNEVHVRQMAERQLVLSNSRYETIFRSSVLGITVTDFDGRICHVNEAWCRMTGYRAEELCAMNINELIAPESSGMDNSQLIALKDGQISSYSMEKKYLRRPQSADDRDFFYGKMVLTQIWDSGTDSTQTMSMVTDITRDVLEAEAVSRSEERFRRIIGQVAAEIVDPMGISEIKPHQLPMKLEEINLELEKLFTHELEENRRKEALIRYQARMAAMGEMIGNIAHQWRQPLNTLRLILSNLKESEQDPVYSETAYAKAHTLIEKMSETIDDFRYFSSPRNDPKYFRVEDALKVVLGLMDEHLRISGIAIQVDCSDLPPLYGLENQFSHVLFNLISNSVDALKAQPSSSERTISVRGQHQEDNAIIRISDSGPGIPPENAERIFDIYFSTKESDGGTGLGLYMARAIVESTFHGSIQLKDSTAGTIFELCIPLPERLVTDRE